MTPRRKQSITYLVASIPALWWGFTTFEYGGHNQGMAIAVSLACSMGILFAVCGIFMLFTKNKLKVMEQMQDEVERFEDEGGAIRLAPEQSALFVDEHVLSAEMIKSYRSLGQTVKQCNAERADIKGTLNSRGITIDEDGNIEVR